MVSMSVEIVKVVLLKHKFGADILFLHTTLAPPMPKVTKQLGILSIHVEHGQGEWYATEVLKVPKDIIQVRGEV